MKVYKNRYDSRYLRDLSNKLTNIEGERGLVETAIALKTPTPPKLIPHTGKEIQYTHLIRIDYVGIAGTTLFDKGGIYTTTNKYEELKNVLNHASTLNESGYFVRLRVLLLYPYSRAGYSRIQAEESTERSSMDEPSYQRNFNIIEQIDEDIFKQSNLYSIQLQMLRNMQILYHELKTREGWTEEDQNKFVIRFTPMDPMMSCIYINKTAFFDVTLLAKKSRQSRRSSQEYCPLVQITEKDRNALSAFEDHFRYLWELDLTMSYSDVIVHSPTHTLTPAKINPPALVSYETKAKTIREHNPKLTEENAEAWKSLARRILPKCCAELYPTPSSETVFITCSWQVDEDGQTIPNQTARELINMIEKDFSGKPIPLLSVQILKATPDEFFTRQLYKALDNATIGLILATRDIECKKNKLFSKPNVYHEMGYLMKELGNERIILIFEEGVEKPSNIHDIVRLEFKTNKISLLYPEIITCISNICGMKNRNIKRIFNNHIKRLDSLFVTGQLTRKEVNATKSKIEETIKKLM